MAGYLNETGNLRRKTIVDGMASNGRTLGRLWTENRTFTNSRAAKGKNMIVTEEGQKYLSRRTLETVFESLPVKEVLAFFAAKLQFGQKRSIVGEKTWFWRCIGCGRGC